MSNLIAGVIGISMLFIFLGVILVWIKALPLIVIVVAVMAMLLYDFVQTLRFGENYHRRR